jgi:hypothetical protein
MQASTLAAGYKAQAEAQGNVLPLTVGQFQDLCSLAPRTGNGELTATTVHGAFAMRYMAPDGSVWTFTELPKGSALLRKEVLPVVKYVVYRAGFVYVAGLANRTDATRMAQDLADRTGTLHLVWSRGGATVVDHCYPGGGASYPLV